MKQYHQNVDLEEDVEDGDKKSMQQQHNAPLVWTTNHHRGITIRRIIIVAVTVVVLAVLIVVLKLVVFPKESSTAVNSSSSSINNNNEGRGGATAVNSSSSLSNNDNDASVGRSVAPTSAPITTNNDVSGDTSVAPTSAPIIDTNNDNDAKSVPTSAPITTNNHVVAPTSAPIILNTSTMQLGCLPDRFDNEEMDIIDPVINFNKLHPGQYICTQPYRTGTSANPVPQRYRFGVNSRGSVVWKDIVTNNETKIYRNPSKSTDVYFALTINGTMVLYNTTTNNVIWKLEVMEKVRKNHPVHHTHRCIQTHDCPYFHLHPDGVLVLNYLTTSGQPWQDRSTIKAYGIALP